MIVRCSDVVPRHSKGHGKDTLEKTNGSLRSVLPKFCLRKTKPKPKSSYSKEPRLMIKL